MSGTLGGQGNPLFVKMGDESWAKDSTLNKIFNALPKKWRENSEAATLATNKNTDATAEANKSQKVFSDKVNKLPWELKGAISQVLTTGLGPSGSVFGQLSQASKGLSTQLSLTAPEWQKTIKVLNGFSIALSVAKMAVDKMFEVDKIFTDIYGSGVRLEGGLQGLITSSSLAGMTLQDFGGLMTKNSTTIAALSGRGVPRLIESFQQATSSGGEFIMSLQENADTFLQTAEIYQQSGITASMTNDQLVGSSRRFIGEISKASEATGMTRKSLLDFVGGLTKTGGSFLLLSTMTDKARENFVNASAQLAKFGQAGGKLLYDNIQKYVAGGGTFGLLDDSMLKLVATVPGLGDSFRNLADGFQKDGKMTDEALNDFAKTLVGAPKALRQQLLAAMPEVAGVLGDLIQNAERVAQQEKDREQRMRKEAADRKVDYEVVKAEYIEKDRLEKLELQRRKAIMTEYESSMNQFNNELMRVYTSMGEGLTPVLQLISGVVKLLADGMVGLNKSITGVLTSIFGVAGEGSILKSVLATKSGPDATSGAGSLLSTAALGATAFGLYKGIQRFRTRKSDPGLGDISQQGPGLFGRGSTPDKPLFVDIVGGMPGGAGAGGGLGPGLGGGAGAGGGAGGGRFGKLLGGAGRLLGKGFLPLSLAMGAFDAFQGFGADPRAGFGSKLLNAGSSALSGATFGLLGSNPEEIAARANAPGMQAANLASAIDLDNINNPRQSAITPTDYQAATIEWQTNVMTTFRAIERLNETMVSILNKIASNTDSLADGLPAQGSGMLPG
jgi:hypothetical protein